jgi:signal transduction histidine kinase
MVGNSKGDTMPMAMRHQVYMILKEALNNSAKYAAATEVKLEVEYLSDKIIIMVADDGKGFDVENARNGNGLQNMQTRAEQIGAQLNLRSSEQGTVITLIIPLP